MIIFTLAVSPSRYNTSLFISEGFSGSYEKLLSCNRKSHEYESCNCKVRIYTIMIERDNVFMLGRFYRLDTAVDS